MKTARKVMSFWRDTGEGRLYEVNPPAAYGSPVRHTSYLWVSAIMASSRYQAEVYIFPADEKSKVLEWQGMPGSYIGGADHEQALRNAGYKVIT